MKKVTSRVAAIALSTMVATSVAQSVAVYADSMPVVTIGADLNESQRDSVLNFFGVDENNVQIIEINNTMEREYLEGVLPDSVIGTRTISCSYTMPTTSGGIQVKTANLNVVTDGMLANALLTSGIENCQVVATAPFEVSGTGALTGVFKAYEKSSETELDEDKKKLATEELVITGDLVSEIVNNPDNQTDTDEEGNFVQKVTEAQILALIADIKIEIINGNLSEDKIKEIVDAHLEEYKVTLREETYNELITYLSKLSEVDYSESIKTGLTDLSKSFISSVDKVFEETGVDFATDKNGIVQFFKNLLNWLKELFELTGDNDSDLSDAKDTVIEFTGGIFDTLNQSDDIKIDSGVWGSDDTSSESDEPSDSTTSDDQTSDVDVSDNNVEVETPDNATQSDVEVDVEVDASSTEDIQDNPVENN